MQPFAIYIRTHPNIKVSPAGTSDHSISLFADDIIMILNEVECSLAVAHGALVLFNKISYYKVNESKSHILGLGIDDSLRNKLQKQYPYTWSSSGITYLGITLTAQVDQLIDANYPPFSTH